MVAHFFRRQAESPRARAGTLQRNDRQVFRETDRRDEGGEGVVAALDSPDASPQITRPSTGSARYRNQAVPGEGDIKDAISATVQSTKERTRVGLLSGAHESTSTGNDQQFFRL